MVRCYMQGGNISFYYFDMLYNYKYYKYYSVYKKYEYLCWDKILITSSICGAYANFMVEPIIEGAFFFLAYVIMLNGGNKKMVIDERIEI